MAAIIIARMGTPPDREEAWQSTANSRLIAMVNTALTTFIVIPD